MKIFTNKEFEEYTKKIQTESYQKGHDKGYDKGLCKGLITNKEGIHINSSGMYIFKDDQ